MYKSCNSRRFLHLAIRPVMLSGQYARDNITLKTKVQSFILNKSIFLLRNNICIKKNRNREQHKTPLNLAIDQNSSVFYLILLEAFSRFPALRELELSLNGLSTVEANAVDFPRLEVGLMPGINDTKIRICHVLLEFQAGLNRFILHGVKG